MANLGDRGSFAGAPRQGGTTSGLSGAAQEFASATARKAEEALGTASDQAQQLAARAGDAWGDFSRMVGRYPLALFVAGVGVGFLLARALDRWPTDMARRMSEASAE